MSLAGLTANPLLLGVVTGGLGLIVGSFLGALTWRLPRGVAVWRGRSACPACGTALGVRDLVPLLSWLLAGGRCRHCAAPVPARYPLIEAATAALFALIAWRLASGGAPGGPLELTLTLALAAVLVALAVIDLEHGILPNRLNALAVALALGLCLARDGWPGLAWGMAGGVAAVAGALALRGGFRLATGRDGLGLGDVKFVAVAGALLRPTDWPPYLLLAGVGGAVIGLAWRRLGRGAEFPFGPALIAALLALLLFPELGAPFVLR